MKNEYQLKIGFIYLIDNNKTRKYNNKMSIDEKIQLK